jgi:hypothetical protein
LSENPDSNYFAERLGEWLHHQDRKTTEQVVLYYSGHGSLVMGEQYLMMTNSDDKNVAATAFLTANIGRMLAETHIRQLMVILDTCHAATGGGDFLTIAQKFSASLRLGDPSPICFYSLAAARPKDEAKQSVFSEAFVRASTEHYASYEALVGSINREFETKGFHQRASVSSLGIQSSPPFLIRLPNLAEPKSRQEYREKLQKALSAELELYPAEIDELFSAFQISDDPKERKKSVGLFVGRLLDDEYSISLLNNLIRKLARRGARVAVEILESCIDQILPFHFAPGEVAKAAKYLNQKGGGTIKGIVTTACGAELVMAAVDQFMSQFDHDDPELRGRPGTWGSYPPPPLGKMGVDEAAEQFLTAVLGTESRESRERMLKHHKIDTERTKYCVVRLPAEGAERDLCGKTSRSCRRAPT